MNSVHPSKRTSKPKHQRGRKQTRLIIGALIVSTMIVAALAGPWIVEADPNAILLERALDPPSWTHPLGRDALGRDLLARVLYGARVACAIAFAGVVLGAVTGVGLGLWAGYRGGLAERAVVRLVDILLVFPGFLLALAAAILFEPGLANLVIAVGFFSFPSFVRVARAMARSLKEEAFVMAARSLGASDARILRRHLFINAAAPLVALASLRMGAAVATASGLSFLGLGPPPPTPEWGSMLDAGRAYLWLAPRLVIVPGAAIFLCSLGFYLLGDGLRQSAELS